MCVVLSDFVHFRWFGYFRGFPTAGCNANVIESCIFSVCHRQLILTDMYKPVNKKYIPQIGAKIYNLRHQVLNIHPSSARAWALGWSD